MTLEVMLCGAADTDDFYEPFREIVSAAGGDAWYYRAGRIVYKNSQASTFAENSRDTVQRVDACVFVINQTYGDITWSVELEEALQAGKPFVVLCLNKTLTWYDNIRRRGLFDVLSDDERSLLEALDRFTARNLTLHAFSLFQFETEMRRALAQLIEHGLIALRNDTLRRNALALAGRGDLSAPQLERLRDIALDETEEKAARKRAIMALAAHGGVDTDTLLSLVDSPEQGVQRLAMRELATLYRPRPADPGFLDDCVDLANNSDDIGLARRLVPALFRLDLPGALAALRRLDLAESGLRRRLATELEEHEADIRERHLRRMAVELGKRCVEGSDVGWVARCRDLIERLEADD